MRQWLTSRFSGGWTLSDTGSTIHFLSVEKRTVMEASHFASIAGSIGNDGDAVSEVAVESIDTSVYLRAVRMRFLMFETFSFPKATITARINDNMLSRLKEARRVAANSPISLDLHGVFREIEADVITTLINENRVSVTAQKPVILQIADFNMMEGLDKLHEAAGVIIVPATSAQFYLVFDQNGVPEPKKDLVASVDTMRPALKSEGNFSLEVCGGRFEILSCTANIYFFSGSSTLKDESSSLLQGFAYVIGNCPGMNVQVSGHTNDVWKRSYNQYLSNQRSMAVVDYPVELGVPAERLISKKYGDVRCSFDFIVDQRILPWVDCSFENRFGHDADKPAWCILCQQCLVIDNHSDVLRAAQNGPRNGCEAAGGYVVAWNITHHIDHGYP